MTLHQNNFPSNIHKNCRVARSHHTLIQTKTKRINALYLTDIVCYTRVTYIVTTADTSNYTTEELLMCTHIINWHAQF